MDAMDIAKDLGHDPDDVRSVAIEPGLVIIVTTDGERHEYQQDYHGKEN